ncbi:PCYCGC motif-containing (lipo)protein [Halobacillus yeomjeoni]
MNLNIHKEGVFLKLKWFLSIGILLGSLLSGCSSHSEEKHEGQEYVNGDIREETKHKEELPSFLDNKNEDMKLLYTAAAESKPILDHIPCYCGCGDSVGHRSNYDCFVHDNRENGAVVWDDHATKCGVCLEIAAQSIMDYQEGKSIEQIRKEIDKKYEEGFPEPTPTPEI